MGWIIDGLDLNTYAYNVSNRSAGWRVPAKRGDNLTIPGRNGVQWIANKPFEAGSVSLSMWAVGATTSGLLPADGDSKRQVRDNLDALTAIFSQTSRLIEVVQVYSTAFGQINAALNPGFEYTNPNTTWTYQNLVLNPSARRRQAFPYLTNLFANPNMETITGWDPYTENLVVDPYNKYQRSTSSAFNLASNYVTPSNFETYSVGDTAIGGGWGVGAVAANTTRTVQALGTGDQSANPMGGLRMLRLQATAALASNAAIGTYGPGYFIPGGQPTLFFRTRRAQNTSTTRTFRFRIRTFQADETTLVATGAWKTVTLPAYPTWTDVTYGRTDSGITPNINAARIVIDFQTGEAWASADGIMLDQMSAQTVHSTGLAQGSNLGYTSGPFDNVPAPYFDGDSPWSTGWNSGTGTSISRWWALPDLRWVPTPPTLSTSAYYAWTEFTPTDPSGTTLGFVAYGFTTGGTQTFTYTCAAPTAGEGYTLRASWRGLNGTNATLTLLKQGSGDASPVTVGSTTMTGSATQTTTGTRMTGAFTNYIVSNSYTAQAGDTLYIRITVPVSTDGNYVGQLNGLSLINGAYGIYSGDTTNSTNTQYTWTGTVQNSKSTLAKRSLKRLDPAGRHAKAEGVYVSGVTSQTFVDSLVPRDGAATAIRTTDIPITTHQGLYCSAEVAGRNPQTGLIPSARLDLVCLDASSNVLNTFSSSVTSLTGTYEEGTGNTTPILLRVVVPAASVPSGTVSLRMSVNAVTPLFGQTLIARRFVVQAAAVDPAALGIPNGFYSGSQSYTVWQSTTDDSVSEYRSPANYPTTWVPLGGVGYPDITGAGVLSATSATGTTTCSLTSALGITYSTMWYMTGAEVKTRVFDTAGNPVSNTSVQVQFGFYLNGTLVGSLLTLATDVYSEGDWQTLQAHTVPPGSFNEVRWIFTSTVPSTYEIEGLIRSSYLYSVTNAPNNYLQRMSVNLVRNPGFTATGLATGWGAVAGTATAATTARGNGVQVTGAGALSLRTGDCVISAGSTYQFAYYARPLGNWTTQVRAEFGRYVSTTWTPTGSTTLPASTDSSQVRLSVPTSPTSLTATAPALSTHVRLIFESVANGQGFEVAWAYVGVDYPTHDVQVDPSVYPYFDGSSTGDLYAQPTLWNGVIDNAPSRVIPNLVNGWTYTATQAGDNVHQATALTYRPNNSRGKLGMLPRALKGSTRTFRTVGAARGANNYLSGQLELGILAYAEVIVGVYGAASDSGTGALLWSVGYPALNTDARQTARWDNVDISAYSYVYVQVTYNETQNVANYRVRLDNLMLLPTVNVLSDYPGYFDGVTNGGGWLGEANNSQSQYFGGGRRAYCEVVEAIDMSSMAGGTRAEFNVEMVIPSSFWEDLVQANVTTTLNASALTSGGQVITVDALLGTTAPIDDAVFTIVPPSGATDLLLTDMATGAWLKITGSVGGQTITIDNAAFTVTNVSTSLIARVLRGGSNQLLPLTPPTAVSAPQIKVQTTGGTGTGSLTVVARRRYVLA